MSTDSIFLGHPIAASERVPLKTRVRVDPGAVAGRFAYLLGTAWLRWRHRIKTRLYEDKDEGIRIAYDEAGHPTRPTLVCVPGFASTKDYFLRLMAILSRDFHVIVPDLPGFGRSSGPSEATYSLAQYGLWLERFLKKVTSGEGGGCHFMGNSLGGAIGLDLSINRRYPLQSLALVAAGGVTFKSIPTIYDEIESGKNPSAVRNFEDYRSFRLRLLKRKDKVPLFIQRYLAQDFVRRQPWYEKILGDLKFGQGSRNKGIVDLEDGAFNDRLHEISCPVLVLWGEKDSFFPQAIGKLIAESIPQARLEIVPEVGHCPQIEAPDEVAGLVKSFLPVAG